MIRVENLHYRYDAAVPDCLCGITLEIEDGANTALIGPNGCGKTTLIKHLNALLVPRAGKVCVDGMATTDPASVREIRRRGGDSSGLVLPGVAEYIMRRGLYRSDGPG